jgi:hypothetical protein
MIPPKYRNVFHVSLRHPLVGLPFTVTMTDAECDAHAASKAPEGWRLDGPVLQGRNNAGERILITTYVRIVPTIFKDSTIFKDYGPVFPRVTVTLTGAS